MTEQDELSSLKTEVVSLKSQVEDLTSKLASEYGNFSRRIDDIGSSLAGSKEVAALLTEKLETATNENRNQENTIHELRSALEAMHRRLSPAKVEGLEPEPSYEEWNQSTYKTERYLFGKQSQGIGVGGRSASEVIDELSRYAFGEFFKTQLPALMALKETYDREKTQSKAREKERDEQARKTEKGRNLILSVAFTFFATVVTIAYRGTIGSELASIRNEIEVDKARLDVLTNEEFARLSTVEAAFERIDLAESWIDRNRKVIESLSLSVKTEE